MKELFYKIPFNFKKLTQGENTQMVSIEESLAQYMALVISTTFGEYKYDEDFGSIIWETDFSFLANPNQLKDQIKESVFEQIKKYEKRITVTEVVLNLMQDTLNYDSKIRVKKRLDIIVYGIIKQTNQPYYFKSSYYLAPFSFK
jgi:phage baseplate assembly protein W